MIKPVIHLNGSGADALFEQYAEAAGALRKAIRVLEEARPNARDYYPLGDLAIPQAQAEHSGRVLRVRGVLDEIEQILEHIADERDARRARRDRNGGAA